jgi:PhzF family phenazine biosynthesis protein
MERRFAQVDVFSSVPLKGNPLAVVLDGEGLSDGEMQQFANWTNLSETTFLLPPNDPGADYLVRIFTPSRELPFAGHPTLGSCAVWLDNGGVPATEGRVVQECGVGLVTLSLTGDRSGFAAPPMLRSGPVETATLGSLADALQIDAAAIVDAQWVDNGPGWVGVLLRDAEAVLAIDPDPVAMADLKIGIAGKSADGQDHALEVRAFSSDGGSIAEDPVTGSLNASLAQWLLGNGTLKSPYVARQGTALGRDGKVYVHEADGEVWIGGDVVTCIRGSVDI